MNAKGGLISGLITLAIGGTIYTVSQTDIVKNFSKDTGLSKKEAQEYVESVTEDDMVPFDELGSDFISDGQEAIELANDLDCVNYEYEWETNTLSCNKAKSQLIKYGNDEVALGKAYTTLASESATKDDISSAISCIDKLNADLNLEIVGYMFDFQTISEIRKENSFNKALLQSALESEQ